MQSVSDGYTIIEVMIFLAISVALLGVSFRLISGKQGQVDFDLSVRNTQSKINDWLNDVSTGFTGGDPGQLNCVINGGKPVINSGGASVSPQCTFLGKVIQFSDKTGAPGQADTLYAYSVFGARLAPSTGELPANLYEAAPVAATAQNGSGNVDLTETFSLAPAEVKSVTSDALIPTTPLPTASPYTTSHLIGFFNSLNTQVSTADNGNTDLTVNQLRFDNSSSQTPRGSAVTSCISLTSPSCKPPGSASEWPEKLKSLRVCLTDGRRTAQITITSSGGFGATTDYSYVAC